MNLRDLERESIRRFVQRAADDGYLSGRVLDYGCGRQPYRDIVEAAGGEYEGYDRQEFPGSLFEAGDVGFIGVSNWMWGFDAILCTQVVQYVPNPCEDVLKLAHAALDSGYLVLTYPTNWPEVEPEDLHRFTKAGMERLLTEAGFTIVRHEARATLYDPQFEYGSGKRLRATGEEFVIGYGAVARA